MQLGFEEEYHFQMGRLRPRRGWTGMPLSGLPAQCSSLQALDSARGWNSREGTEELGGVQGNGVGALAPLWGSERCLQALEEGERQDSGIIPRQQPCQLRER